MYELRQIAEAEAVSYVREPALFIRLEQARQAEARKQQRVVSSPDWDFWKEFTAIDTERHYSWKLLLGLVSVSDEAFNVIVHGGQSIGGVEESWQLGASAEVLNAAQVTYLFDNLAAAPVEPAVELYEIEAAQLFQDLLLFLQRAVETGSALLMLQAP